MLVRLAKVDSTKLTNYATQLIPHHHAPWLGSPSAEGDHTLSAHARGVGYGEETHHGYAESSSSGIHICHAVMHMINHACMSYSHAFPTSLVAEVAHLMGAELRI